MGAWDRSLSITRTSLAIMRKDSEMIWFPILSGIFSLLFAVALLVPAVAVTLSQQTAAMSDHADASELVLGPLQVVVLFVTYFGLAFIATFFNVCVVHTTRVRLSGGDATFLESLKFAFSRIHLIAAWSAVSATVGLLLRAIDAAAERLGLAGKILLWLLRTVLASAWVIMTVFVVPAMVYRDLGPFDAIRDSLAVLERTWGDALVRYFGVGLVSFVCAIPCLLLVVGGFMAIETSGVAAAVSIATGALGFLAVSLVFGVLGTVWKTVLYHWATTGVAPEGLDPSVLQSAFVRRAGT